MLRSGMFGFLKPVQSIPEWRRSYARICQYQRRQFGLTSLPFLSYEATVLYQLAVDTELIPSLPDTSPECCRLRKIREPDSQPDCDAAGFCAAFGLLLAGVKLRDDVADSGRWSNRLLEWKYRKQVQAACEKLESFSPGINEKVQANIRSHASLEQPGVTISISEYSLPTGNGFKVVFEALSRFLAPNGPSSVHELFATIGQLVGGAIIAWDCAVDFDKDRIKGEFNPLQNEAGVQQSMEYCLMQLAEIGWQLPEGSTTQRVIASVSRRVRLRQRTNSARCTTRKLEQWGFLREKGFAYARCDGCDALCAVGECCECLGGVSEAAACDCGPTCIGCPCDGCCLCVEDNGPCRTKSKTERASQVADGPEAEQSVPYAKYLGTEGVADSNLNPSGYILFDDVRAPGKSKTGEYLPAGTQVRVIQTDSFGVHVVRADSPN